VTRQHRHRPWRSGCGAALCAALLGASLAAAQTPAPEPDKTAKQSDERPAKDAFRTRLERRLNDSRENQKALEEAISKLDKGATPDDIRRSFADRPGVNSRLFGDEEGPRFGPDGPRPGHDRDPDRPLSAEDQKAVLEVLAATYPAMVEKLNKLFTEDPDAAKQKVTELGPRVRFLLDLRERDPEMYRLRLDEVKTAREAVAAARDIAAKRKAGASLTSPELREPMQHLRDLVVAQLRTRLAVERRELADLQKRAEQKSQEIDAHISDNGAMVDKQVDSLLDRADKGKPDADPLRPHQPGRKPQQHPPG
jgi:hypothetical protein